MNEPYVFAFDIGATKTAVAIMDFEGRFPERPIVIEPTPQDYQEAMGRFRIILEGVYSSYDIKFIAGGAPAMNGSSGEFIQNPSNLPLWGGKSLKGSLESIVRDIIRKTHGRYPLIITKSDSYMTAAGASMAKLAQAQDPSSFFPLLSIIQGTGTSAEESEHTGNGFEISTSSNGRNLAAGHSQFSGTAPRKSDIYCGHCQRPNCAETWLGGKHMKERYGAEPKYATSKMKEEIADNLAKFLAITKWPYEPRTVLLLGGIPNRWEEYTELVTRYFPHHQRNGGQAPKIEQSALRNNAALIGAWAEVKRFLEGVWPKFDLRGYIENQAVLYKN